MPSRKIAALALLLTVSLLACSACARPPEISGEVVMFSATWCGPCQSMHKIIREAKEQGIPITVYDIDDDKALSKRHRVTAVPTFLKLDNRGREVARRSGAMSLEELRRFAER